MDDVENETHPLLLPDTPIVMPSGEIPVARDGTIGGIPAYEADEKHEVVAPRKSRRSTRLQSSAKTATR